MQTNVDKYIHRASAHARFVIGSTERKTCFKHQLRVRPIPEWHSLLLKDIHSPEYPELFRRHGRWKYRACAGSQLSLQSLTVLKETASGAFQGRPLLCRSQLCWRKDRVSKVGRGPPRTPSARLLLQQLLPLLLASSRGRRYTCIHICLYNVYVYV